MLFNSFPFLLFFLCYLSLHILCPPRWRVWLVIAGSAIFYGYWNWLYTGLPFALTLLTFLAAVWVLQRPPGQRRGRLAVAIVLLLTPLAVFKYANFIWLDVLGPMLGWFGWRAREPLFDLALPLGISFVTFTLLAYLIDYAVGRFRQPPSLKWLLGYVLFFPHLISGPILRPNELIPQLQGGMPVRLRAMLPGLALIACGLVKKMLVADSIAPAVDAAYSGGSGLARPDFVLALYAFPVQIYCDLSGYTDIALGLARLLGVRLPGNFRQPYCATSLTQFWQHWHMTLTYWFRDYVFFNLPGSRRRYSTALRNVVITMVLTGAWHGSRWTFIAWGLLNGLVMVAERLAKRAWRKRTPPPAWVGRLITFHIVALLLVLFRSRDFAQAAFVYGGLFGGGSIGDLAAFFERYAFPCLLIPVFLAVHRWDDNRRLVIATRRLGPRLSLALIAAAFFFSIVIGMNNTTQFIYFEF